MVLAEKGVPFESRVVNLLAGEQHDPEYVKLNPDHVVPTFVVDGEVLLESTPICEFIDDYFDGPALRPTDAFQRYHATALMRFVDTRIHGHVSGVPTHAILTRGLMADRSPEQIAAYLAAIPDPAERALRTSLITHGVEAPEIPGALRAIARFIGRLEARLAGEQWFSSTGFGLADAGVLPYVIRFRDLGLAGLWEGGARPRVADWVDRAIARPTFAEAFTKWLPEPLAAAFARISGAARPALEPMVQAANEAAQTAASQ